MLSDADLASLRHDFANDRFDLTPDAHRNSGAAESVWPISSGPCAIGTARFAT